MKNVLILVGLFFATLGGTAFADSVTFSTSGSFSGLAQTDNFTFTGVSNVSVTSPIQNTLFGTINVPSGATGTLAQGNSGFTLDITQTDPAAGSGSLDAFLTGQITVNGNGTITLHFTTSSVVIGGETYSVSDIKLSEGANQLLGNIIPSSATAVPEPQSLVLFGSGLLAAAGFVRRRALT